MSIKSVNPYNNQKWKEYTALSAQGLLNEVQTSFDAYQSWKRTTFEERTELMHQCASQLQKDKEHLASLITLEMGKIITESHAEIDKCSLVCQYYADNAKSQLSDEPLHVSNGQAYIHFNSIGPVLAIMPWNFPFWQVFRFAAPNLMVGNTGILKHASNVPQCAIAIEETFMKAGFPKGVFTTLLIGSEQVNSIIENKNVAAVTLTGSEEAGSSVASHAGKNLKKVVLELGGSDPFIVLRDANLKLAAETAVKARMINCGQSCIAAKRFIIAEQVYDKFLGYFSDRLNSMNYGDPSNPYTTLGPLASIKLAKELHQQVRESLKSGAKLLYGELPKEINSAMFFPIILGDIPQNCPAYDEELFGPVACFFKVKNEQEAIELANNSQFGLGASVWTENNDLGEKVAYEIESGAVYVNKMMASDPSVPFGGVKRSGFGRELSKLGIKEFANQKTIWVA